MKRFRILRKASGERRKGLTVSEKFASAKKQKSNNDDVDVGRGSDCGSGVDGDVV